MTAKDAVKLIKSGDRVLIQGGSATPQTLVRAMVERAPELKGVEIVHLHTEGECGYTAPELRESFHTNAFFHRRKYQKNDWRYRRLYSNFFK